MTSAVSTVTAAVSLFTAALVLLLLAALHVLSPEFDPSWRVVSEYANGHYGWLLSLMFAFWAVSSWSLAASLGPYLHTITGRIGFWFLLVAGAGEAMAALFDINQPLHGLAGLLGLGGFCIAAILLNRSLREMRPWSGVSKPLAWATHLSWIMVICMVASLIVLFVTYTHAGGRAPADGNSLPLGTVLPAGAIALDGYVNRLLIVVFCAWVMIAGWPYVASHANMPSRVPK